MLTNSIFTVATSHNKQIMVDWIPATGISPFIFNDPGVIWLEYHGSKHGFQPNTSPYEFLDFISEKARQF